MIVWTVLHPKRLSLGGVIGVLRPRPVPSHVRPAAHCGGKVVRLQAPLKPQAPWVGGFGTVSFQLKKQAWNLWYQWLLAPLDWRLWRLWRRWVPLRKLKGSWSLTTLVGASLAGAASCPKTIEGKTSSKEKKAKLDEICFGEISIGMNFLKKMVSLNSDVAHVSNQLQIEIPFLFGLRNKDMIHE